MVEAIVEEQVAGAVPITAVTEAAFAGWRGAAPAPVRNWLDACAVKAKAGTQALVPGADGGLERVVAVVEDRPDLWSFAGLPAALPPGSYRLDAPAGFDLDARLATAAALGWLIGGYRFERYRKPADGAQAPCLAAPAGADLARARRLARAHALVRDLVNTPANDMGPAELAAAAREVAGARGAAITVIEGEALLDAGYPMIHAVGRASARAPRLIDLAWGDAGAPRLTLVGKGVCFDSGGLDLKTADGMRLMKKDMGGAAHALALADAIMDANLAVRLRVLIPAVENSVSGSAFRPGDVLATRAGRNVEIGNTDAEGRLVLCDALAEADREAPRLLIDLATLTGAARVALGPDVPALFTDDDALAADLARHATGESDPLWRLPLWRGYRKDLDSEVADICNISDAPFAGAITAALFLREFLEKTDSWAHFDIMAWNRASRPGRPKGGEAVALRALYALVAERFAG